jgi:putative transposase
MPRIARVVAPGLPHHITQRGNRRQQTFFLKEDYQAYLTFMADWCGKCRVEIWAYCLMPNHIHLIAVPASEGGLRSSIGEAHKRYTRVINAREGWKGHLWQGRFFSYPLDEASLLTAVLHIETNPVRAGLVDSPDRYPWCSAGPHLNGRDDTLVKVKPLLDRMGNWGDFLSRPASDRDADALRRHEKTGRPLGTDAFVRQLERDLTQKLVKQKPGPKPKHISP